MAMRSSKPLTPTKAVRVEPQRTRTLSMTIQILKPGIGEASASAVKKLFVLLVTASEVRGRIINPRRHASGFLKREGVERSDILLREYFSHTFTSAWNVVGRTHLGSRQIRSDSHDGCCSPDIAQGLGKDTRLLLLDVVRRRFEACDPEHAHGPAEEDLVRDFLHRLGSVPVGKESSVAVHADLDEARDDENATGHHVEDEHDRSQHGRLLEPTNAAEHEEDEEEDDEEELRDWCDGVDVCRVILV